ncbi:MAG: PfkB family carbohydrate kinase [Dehalococcoidia bacterium]|nr:PfkB family carbohydrate kinase [Dehalococcoidia bacterium]
MCLGHVTRDIVGDGWVLGGSVTFAALTAKALGVSVAVVTSANPADLDGRLTVPVVIVPAAATTTFHNVYGPDGRRQRLLARAAPLSVDAMPTAWRSAPIVHLAPLAGELSPTSSAAFPRSLVVVSAQGWLRAWDRDGVVRFRPWPPEWRLDGARVVVISREDVNGDERLADPIVAGVELAIITRGADGALLRWAGREHIISAYPAREVDPTGAGDVFTAAFAIRLVETDDPLEAADFASAAASLAVTAPGATGIPTRAQVAARRAEAKR